MNGPRLTEQDLKYCRAVWMNEIVPSVEDETYDGPTTLVVSVGYVDVWRDGAVTSHHTKIASVGDDWAEP